MSEVKACSANRVRRVSCAEFRYIK
ncbi:uncharacterized protein G2W53_002968 [Senna tora]|uniref:Uncharacterized protein n=1 Tax=Senna tora TaxID=362788 RepID=A0A834X9F9_9FABA|nr:uncharacterized protein G2W53_002968 [Senna tora]